MLSLKKMKHLSNSEIKEINRKIRELYGIDGAIGKKDKAIIEEGIIIINSKKIFFADTAVPTLRNVLDNKELYDNMKKVTVDMGAVKFVTSGADIMRPGIVAFDDNISKDSIVLIIDEKHKKPLAVGKMLIPCEEAKNLTTGKIIKNMHYIGDKVWNN